MSGETALGALFFLWVVCVAMLVREYLKSMAERQASELARALRDA